MLSGPPLNIEVGNRYVLIYESTEIFHSIFALSESCKWFAVLKELGW